MAFNEPTIFIVGAGASLPYGYPLGQELVERIEKDASPRMKDYINLYQPFSIDNFIAHHCDDELKIEGKQLIAKHILICESGAKLNGLENANWYRFLVNNLFDNLSQKKTINTNNLTIKEKSLFELETLEERLEWLNNFEIPFRIITFNYDVSLDYYILERIWQAPLLDLPDDNEKKIKRELLKKLGASIMHVYGQVRDVPWGLTNEEWDNPEYAIWKAKNKDYYFITTNNNGNGLIECDKKITLSQNDYLLKKHEKPYNEQMNKLYFGIEHYQKTKPFTSDCLYELRIKYSYGGLITKGIFLEKYGISTIPHERTIHYFNEEVGYNTQEGKNFIKEAAERIRVIREERNDNIQKDLDKKLKEMQKYMLETAKCITFLGFGFDDTNMELIFPQSFVQGLLFGVGCLQKDKEYIANLLFNNDVKLTNVFLTLKAERRPKIKLQYTNYGDSEKINRKLEKLFYEINSYNYGKCGFDHIKSIKDVYGALTSDFDL